MNNKVAAFGQRRAGVYLLSEIYNPDDTSSSVQNINKVIPAIGSLVVDDTVGEHNTLYVVYSVDAVTHKSTLVNAAFNESSNMVGDDANTMRMLFFSHDPVEHYYIVDVSGGRQPGVEYYIKSGNAFVLYTEDFETGVTYYSKKNFTALHIDGRLSVYTSLADKYTIYHSASSTVTEAQCISQYYLEDGALVESNMIPMEQIVIPATTPGGDDTVTDAYRPVTCYTDLEMVEGDKYLVDVYDVSGGIISQFTLTGHDMSALVDINGARRAITNMTVQCNQTSGNQFIILSNQTLDDLAFFLTIEYDHGDPVTIAIDNVNAFMHADISSITVGGTIPIIFKYYPSPSESLGIANASTNSYTIGATGRYISVTKSLTMVESAAAAKSKIAPIIYYRNNTFGIAPLVYFADHSSTPVLAVDYGEDKAVTGFTPSNLSSVQIVTLTYRKESNAESVSYVSKASDTYNLKLNPSTEPSKVFYYFSDTTGVYYGRSPRPKLIRTGQAEALMYKFSIASATGDFSAKDLFLKHYFYNANPPAPYGFSDALQPTHFRIRQLIYTNGVATGTELISSEYSIDDFFSLIESARIVTTTSNIYTNLAYPNTVIVEFLAANLDLGNGYDIIYGVPVDVTLN